MKSVLAFNPDAVILGADPPRLNCCGLLSEIKGSQYLIQRNREYPCSSAWRDTNCKSHFKLRIDLNPNPIDVDTGSLRTYTVSMNVTLSIDEQVVARARKKAKALGKSLNELIRDYLQKLAGGDHPERSIEEFEHLSGRGHSRGWRFNRDEIHERS